MKIKIMKPFSLEEAKNGKPICTRDGRKARIVCFEAKTGMGDNTLIVSIVTENDGCERVFFHDRNGKYTCASDTEHDLMMVEDEEPKCPFKPFDRVLVRENDEYGFFWDCSLFSRYNLDDEDEWFWFITLDGCKNHMCIPYNEETEHLIGTADDAPEKYVIW